MATGTKKGLNPARKVGSAPDSKGLTTYAIATGYATTIGKGDPVKLVSGVLNRGTNDTADCIGVFKGVKYTDSTGTPKFSNVWVASTAATDIEALVMDDPNATFTMLADAAVTSVVPGDIYALNISDADTSTGQSTMTVDVSATVAATLGMVKIIKVVDDESLTLEVVLVDHDLRDDG